MNVSRFYNIDDSSDNEEGFVEQPTTSSSRQRLPSLNLTERASSKRSIALIDDEIGNNDNVQDPIDPIEVIDIESDDDVESQIFPERTEYTPVEIDDDAGGEGRILWPNGVPAGICKKMKKRPREGEDPFAYLAPYQMEASDKIKIFNAILLFFDMGSGKTASALCAAENLLKNKTVKDVYLICPKSVKETWLQEAEDWGCKRTLASLKKFRHMRSWASKGKGPDSGAMDFNDFADAGYEESCFIIDEAHIMRSQTSQEAKAWLKHVFRLDGKKPFKKVIMLTGTPCYQYIADIAILLKTLRPTLWRQFLSKTFGVEQPTFGENSLKGTQISNQKFNAYFTDENLKVQSDVWLKDFTQNVVLCHRRNLAEYCPLIEGRLAQKVIMTPEHEKLYDALVEALEKERRKNTGNNDKSKSNKQPFKKKQKQLAPGLLNSGPVADDIPDNDSFLVRTRQYSLGIDLNDLKAHKIPIPQNYVDSNGLICEYGDTSNKKYKHWTALGYERIKEVLEDCNVALSAGDKSVIFCEHYRGLEILEALIKRDFKESIGPNFAAMNPRQSDADRQETLEDFNDPNGFTKVLAISPASSTGVNLKETRHMFVVAPVWQQGLKKQIYCRIWRKDSHRDLSRPIIIHRYLVDKRSTKKDKPAAEVRVTTINDAAQERIETFEKRIMAVQERAANQ